MKKVEDSLFKSLFAIARMLIFAAIFNRDKKRK